MPVFSSKGGGRSFIAFAPEAKNGVMPGEDSPLHEVSKTRKGRAKQQGVFFVGGFFAIFCLLL